MVFGAKNILVVLCHIVARKLDQPMCLHESVIQHRVGVKLAVTALCQQ